MNVEDSSPATSTKHWLPSHVQITILQARELHLKNKSGPSELYVSLQVDKDRFLTSSVPKQHNPYWNEVFVIPLMSLASTVHVTVRQKGRFGDSYIGYIPLNTGSFKVDPNQVTHWHKLGPKPGKPSTKLRGDLQVSFQFLSEWSSAKKVSVPGHIGGMLKHSSSDMRLSSNMRHTNSDEALSNGKLKNRLRSSIRRSFRRKNKPVVVQTSTDDFEAFVSHSASSTPQNVRKRITSSSNMPDTISNSVSSASMLSNGPSDSDSVSQSSPIPIRRAHRASESEEGSLVAVDREKEGGEGGGGGSAISPQDGKMPHASQFYNFRSKKRPFSMHSIPTSTPSPASTPMLASERLVGGALPQQVQLQPEEDKVQGQAVVVEKQGAKVEEGTEEEKDKESKQQPQEASVDKQEEEEVTAFKYRPRGAILSKSFRVSDSSIAAARLAGINKNVESKSVEDNGGKNSATSVSGAESSAGHNRSTSDGQHPGGRRESGYGTDRLRQSSLSEESSTCNSTEGSRTELSTPTTAEGTSSATEHNGHAKPLPKTHPYSRRIDITPRASSPKVRPRVLKTDPDSRGNKPRPASLVRRSTLSSIPSGRRLLPATPVRRGQRASLTPGNTTDGKTSLSEDSSDSFAKKLANSLEKVASKEEGSPQGSPQDDLSEDSFRGREGSGGESSLLHTSPSESTNSINSSVTSREDLGGANLKKHTVQYKNKDAAFQPVSLLPPSLSDYTTRSQTLPTRGKHSKKKRLPLNSTQTQVPADEGDGKPSSDSTHGNGSPSPSKPASNHSPANTKLTPKALIDHMRPPSPSGSLSEKSTDLDNIPARATMSNPGLSKIVRSHSSTSASPTRQQSTSATSPTIRYGGKTPGEIVASSLRNRQSTRGGLKKAITMYQESRRMSATSRKLSSEDSPAPGGVFVGDLDSLKRFERLSQGTEAGTRSARTSPQMSRASINQRGGSPGGGGITNLFNTLRRTRSHFFTPSSSATAAPPTPTGLSTSTTAPAPSKTRHISASDLQDCGSSPSPSFVTPLPRGGLRLGSDGGSLSNIAPSLQNTSAPGILMMVREREREELARGDERGSSRKDGLDGNHDDDDDSSGKVSDIRIRIRTATMTSADSAKTLTETTPSVSASITSSESAAAAASTADSKEHRFSPNPAGAASAASGGSHVRHTTNSSVESEGFHSIMSEDVSMEDVLNQDWTHWSREELIRELISCKEKLVSTEGQLRETKSYMDSLLLRVMETNPSILSAN